MDTRQRAKKIGRSKASILECATILAEKLGSPKDLIDKMLNPKGMGEDREANRLEHTSRLFEDFAYQMKLKSRPAEPVIRAMKDCEIYEGDPDGYIGDTPKLKQKQESLLASEQAKWALVTGPVGAVIDSQTGVVIWPNPVVKGSPHVITVAASNNVGGCEMGWFLTVSVPDSEPAPEEDPQEETGEEPEEEETAGDSPELADSTVEG